MLVLVGAVAAIPVVWSQGISEAEGCEEQADVTTSSGAETVVAETGVSARVGTGVSPRPAKISSIPVDYEENWDGAQMTLINLETGEVTGTATQRFARPALSLVKLYLAYYVIAHGDVEDHYAAAAMVSDSNDRTAQNLAEKYPDAIEQVAEEFDLFSTRAGERWGASRTSTYDVATFIAALRSESPSHPVLVAMALADPVAADGYKQDFGTAVLPGEIGTKWAWSDAQDLHSTVSFGENWVAAAAVSGDAEDLSDFVEAQLATAVE